MKFIKDNLYQIESKYTNFKCILLYTKYDYIHKIYEFQILEKIPGWDKDILKITSKAIENFEFNYIGTKNQFPEYLI